MKTATACPACGLPPPAHMTSCRIFRKRELDRIGENTRKGEATMSKITREQAEFAAKTFKAVQDKIGKAEGVGSGIRIGSSEMHDHDVARHLLALYAAQVLAEPDDVKKVRKYLSACRNLASMQSEADAADEAIAALDRIAGMRKPQPALPFNAGDVAMLREVAGGSGSYYVHLHGLAIRLEEALKGKVEQPQLAPCLTIDEREAVELCERMANELGIITDAEARAERWDGHRPDRLTIKQLETIRSLLYRSLACPHEKRAEELGMGVSVLTERVKELEGEIGRLDEQLRLERRHGPIIDESTQDRAEKAEAECERLRAELEGAKTEIKQLTTAVIPSMWMIPPVSSVGSETTSAKPYENPTYGVAGGTHKEAEPVSDAHKRAERRERIRAQKAEDEALFQLLDGIADDFRARQSGWEIWTRYREARAARIAAEEKAQ